MRAVRQKPRRRSGTIVAVASVVLALLVSLLGVVPAAADGGSADPPAPLDLGDEVRASRLAVGGSGFACAVRSDGTLNCWGRNSSTMATYPPAGTYVSVGAGQQFGCALDAEGATTCWGLSSSGRLVPPEVAFVDLTVGFNHSCGLDNTGQAHCWGDLPIGIAPPATPFVELSADQSHTCGLTAQGGIECWGSNWSGQLDIPEGEFTSVTAGGAHTCALRPNGAVQCWGSNNQMQAVAPEGAFRAVDAGASHTCAIAVDHTAACWGGTSPAPAGQFAEVVAGSFNSCGVRFDGTVECWDGMSPPRGEVSAVSLSKYHICLIDNDGESDCAPDGISGPWERLAHGGAGTTCGVRVDGSLECWGQSTYGLRSAPEGTFVDVGMGSRHACAIRADETLVCWGEDTNSRLDAPAGTFTRVRVAADVSCAIATSGEVSCWGNNADFQLDTPGGSYVDVAVAGVYACAVRTDGEMDCWGRLHQIGQPPAAPATGFVAVGSSNQHTCALIGDGSVQCWGNPSGGLLQVPPGDWTQLEAGRAFTCALRDDGVANCWGDRVAIGDPFTVVVDEVPEPPELDVWPRRFGDTGPISLRVLGISAELVTGVSLSRDGGATTIGATSILDAGIALTEARFVLDATPVGPWDVIVRLADGTSVVLVDAVTVEPAMGKDLYVRINAPSAMRATQPSMVVLTVGNRGNTDARAVPLYLAGMPEGTRVESRFSMAELPAEPLPGLDGRLIDPRSVPRTFEEDVVGAMAPIVVSNVPPGSEVNLALRMFTPEIGDFELVVWANACLGDLPFTLDDGEGGAGAHGHTELDALATCMLQGLELMVDVALDFAPGGGCVKGGYQQFAKSQVASAAASATFAALGDEPTGTATWGNWAASTIGSAVVDCAADVFPVTKALKVAKNMWTWGNRLSTLSELGAGCEPVTVPVRRFVRGVGSFDPNEKVGPAGFGPQGYTTPDVPVGYTISFENDPSATAAAQIVEVTDEIDTVVFDPESIQLGPMIIAADQVIHPPPGVREWASIVDLDGHDELLGVDVVWDDVADTLTWTLTTLDPVTLELTEDALAGFLPPNVEPAEGEGSVSFSIEPRERTDGVVLANGASIVFDTNEPIVTDTWVNTLDGTPPTATVDPLPGTVAAPSFEVTWSGEDELSGIGGYELWYAVDGGASTLWFSTDDADHTSSAFVGERGRTYAFTARAWDNAGNLAELPSDAQATTTVAASQCTTTAEPGPFPDVGPDHPFCVDIEWLADAGITGGYGDGTFRPGAPISRQAMAAFLWRLKGEPPVVLDGGPFPDVEVDHPFAEAIAWLADAGIAGGYADGTFRPSAPISRQAMSAFLWRLQREPAVVLDGGPFSDVGVDHPFAEAIAWLADAGIAGGYADGTFRPTAAITRQAMAAFLHRLVVPSVAGAG